MDKIIAYFASTSIGTHSHAYAASGKNWLFSDAGTIIMLNALLT